MPKKLKLGSLFDGIGGWCLSAVRNGIEPVWSSEIETFPMEVTKKHFPNVKQLGDIRNIDGAKVEPVDIITAGSPCQDFSVANGNGRKGLEGERSGLFTESVRIVRQMRKSSGGVHCRFYILENVPGILSSNKGMDFRDVLSHITNTEIPIPRSGRWANSGLVRSRQCDVGWRMFNAKYFGTPQSRKRIFVIADFGKTERCAEKILFEQKGDSWNFKTRKKGETISQSIKRCDVAGNIAINTPKDCGCVPIACRMRCGKDGGGKGALIGFDKCFTLSTHNDQIIFQEIGGRYKVRKLMPVEMERLQSLPDGWTFLPGSKLCSNSARIKALGNGMTQSVPDWIVSRLVYFVKEEHK